MSDDTPVGEMVEILVVEIAGVRYGLPLSHVLEVIRAVYITPLPDAPDVVEGVIEVRGRIVPVFDLRLRFGLPSRHLDPAEQIVIVKAGRRRAGLRCDRTDWIERIAPQRLRDAPAIVRRGRRLAGLASLDDGLVVIHDPERFLADAERESLDRALAAQDRA